LLERRVLKAIADRSVSLSSREAETRFGLAKGRSTQEAARRLFEAGQLVEDGGARSGWRVVDPFLASWLRDEGEPGRPGGEPAR
jgi:hypothetical protein